MNRVWLIVLAVVLLLVPVVLAASFSEDFESYPHLTVEPDSPLFEYDLLFLEATVVGYPYGDPSGVNALMLNPTAGENHAWFLFNAPYNGPPSQVSFWAQLNGTSGSFGADVLIDDVEEDLLATFFITRNGQISLNGDVIVSAGACAEPNQFILSSISAGAGEYDLDILSNVGASCYSSSEDFQEPGFSDLARLAVGIQTDGGASPFFIDGITVGAGESPDPPPGLVGKVDSAPTSSSSGLARFAWGLAPNDADQTLGDFSYHVYVDGVEIIEDPITSDDTSGIRRYTWRFQEGEASGPLDVLVKTENVAASCTITLDFDVPGSLDSCGAPPPLVGGVPSEFDQGLEDSLEAFGFQSAESKMFFSLVLVGGVTVIAGSVSKFMAASRFKNYLLLGVGAVVAVFMVFTGFLNLWEWIVAFMLGVFAVKGAGAARNTYLEIKEALQRRRAGGLGPDDALGMAGEAFGGASTAFMGQDTRGAEDGLETPENDAESES